MRGQEQELPRLHRATPQVPDLHQGRGPDRVSPKDRLLRQAHRRRGRVFRILHQEVNRSSGGINI